MRQQLLLRRERPEPRAGPSRLARQAVVRKAPDDTVYGGASFRVPAGAGKIAKRERALSLHDLVPRVVERACQLLFHVGARLLQDGEPPAAIRGRVGPSLGGLRRSGDW